MFEQRAHQLRAVDVEVREEGAIRLVQVVVAVNGRVGAVGDQVAQEARLAGLVEDWLGCFAAAEEEVRDQAFEEAGL